VTDRHRVAPGGLPAAIEAALQGGVDAVQLREKDLSGRDLYELALVLRSITRQHGARLLINDRIDVAHAVQADGVHLPHDSFHPADARALLGSRALVGASTHARTEAVAAQAAGVDYIVFGPVFDTPSKRAYGPPLGVEALHDLATSIDTPILAIGGIDPSRARIVLAHGAAGIAVIGAILDDADPRTAASALAASRTTDGEALVENRPHRS